MQGWTAERVRQLAPDEASAKAGQGLAAVRHWVSCGVDETALFGECQGSGSKPYQVRIDLAEPAFKCSCPSRKFPCKHSIGLLLMHAAGEVPAAERPAWVAEWFAERAARAEKKQPKAAAPAAPIDPAAQARRREKRLSRIADGLAALRLWIADLVRTGIASAPTRGYEFFDSQARRLIDAQAPGVARRVQKLGEIAASGAGWQTPFVEQLSLLHLLVEGFGRLDQLPEAVRETLLAVIGIARSTDEILQCPAITDSWQIIGQEVTIEDRLRAQQTWLWGRRSGQVVLVLHFAHGTQPLDVSLPPGSGFEGEVCLVPGNTLRGVVRMRGDLSPLQSLDGPASIDALCDLYSTFRAANPWLEGVGVALRGVRPARRGEQWVLADDNGQAMSMRASDRAAWVLAAVSGGAAVDVAVHFDGQVLRPLGTISDGRYVRLVTPENEGEA